jgi:hypothetical protein
MGFKSAFKSLIWQSINQSFRKRFLLEDMRKPWNIKNSRHVRECQTSVYCCCSRFLHKTKFVPSKILVFSSHGPINVSKQKWDRLIGAATARKSLFSPIYVHNASLNTALCRGQGKHELHCPLTKEFVAWAVIAPLVVAVTLLLPQTYFTTK